MPGLCLKAVREERHGATHAEGRNEEDSDCEQCLDDGEDAGISTERMVQGRINSIEELKYWFNECRTEANRYLKNSVNHERSSPPRRAAADDPASRREAQKHRGQRCGDRWRGGSEHGGEPTHPQHFVNQREGT